MRVKSIVGFSRIENGFKIYGVDIDLFRSASHTGYRSLQEKSNDEVSMKQVNNSLIKFGEFDILK